MAYMHLVDGPVELRPAYAGDFNMRAGFGTGQWWMSKSWMRSTPTVQGFARLWLKSIARRLAYVYLHFPVNITKDFTNPRPSLLARSQIKLPELPICLVQTVLRTGSAVRIRYTIFTLWKSTASKVLTVLWSWWKIGTISKQRKFYTVEAAMISAKQLTYFSKAQYEKKLRDWGFRRNRSSDAWRIAGEKIDLRKRFGKRSSVYLHGQLVPARRVSREVSRHRIMPSLQRFDKTQSRLSSAVIQSTFLKIIDRTAVPTTPPGFNIRTPTSPEVFRLLFHNLPILSYQDTISSLAGEQQSVPNAAMTDQSYAFRLDDQFWC
jgi:hypothetical protein